MPIDPQASILMLKKLIALVGRPNVGKSTLFNRLSIGKKAIVHDMPGVTRDRKYADARIGPMEFIVIDTPGLEEAEEGKLEYEMMKQTMIAIQEADLVCLIVDNIQGLTPADKFFANFIRKNNDNHILIVNKSEKNFSFDQGFFKLGFGTPIPVSAEHGQGMMSLYESIAKKIDIDNTQVITDPIKAEHIQIVITGRPNSGKSTFINAIIGKDRMLTGHEAGVTRESVEISWKYKGQTLKLIDTAGLRKRSNIKGGLEKLSSEDAINSIKFANTVILVLDATLSLEKQDLNIANYVIDQGRSLVIAVNKWDLITDKKDYQQRFTHFLETALPQAKGIPVVYISALNKLNISSALDSCLKIYRSWNKRISTSRLNYWLHFATEKHPLPIQRKLGRRVKIKYATQIKTRPPTFKLFTNDPASISDSYKQYLINLLREDFDMPGIPIRMFFAKSKNPYASRD